MSLHVESVRNYVLVFLALMVLTVLTVGVAYFDFGFMNDIIAMGIAVLKATLVVLIFMNVRNGTRLTKLVVVAGFFWLIILFAFTLADYDTRSLLVEGEPAVYGK